MEYISHLWNLNGDITLNLSKFQMLNKTIWHSFTSEKLGIVQLFPFFLRFLPVDICYLLADKQTSQHKVYIFVWQVDMMLICQKPVCWLYIRSLSWLSDDMMVCIKHVGTLSIFNCKIPTLTWYCENKNHIHVGSENWHVVTTYIKMWQFNRIISHSIQRQCCALVGKRL